MWKAGLALFVIVMIAAVQALWLLGNKQYKECAVTLGLFAVGIALLLIQSLRVPVPSVFDMLTFVSRPIQALLF
ncbi:hypothetical protein [Paenibacillus puerhi]|uniref:hypothetical protein n=1 Tax=Paenibacillus puerhi TaxID=2692622 RepID=UPI001357F803|nr:hypothetical protein [Paenibacillus puerhi]